MDGGWGEDGEGGAVEFGLEHWTGVRSPPCEAHEVALIRVNGHADSGKGVDCSVKGLL